MYREFKPIVQLQPFIQCIWIMKASAGVFTQPERLVPDGNIELLFNYGDAFIQIHGENNDQKIFKGSQLVGQRSSYIFTATSGKTDLISVSFKPGGLSPFVDIPVTDLTDCTISPQLLDKVFSEIEERIFDCTSLEEKVDLIQQLLLTHMKNRREKLEKVERFVPVLHHLSKYSSVAHFLKDNIIHERKLQRQFDQYVGISPKFLQRVLRFKSTVAAFYSGKIKTLTQLAYDRGYYDQAHFINEFKFFSGLTPKQYFYECKSAISEVWTSE